MGDTDNWQRLKDEMHSVFVYGYYLEGDTPNEFMNEAYGIVLKRMCELDGTEDFTELLEELEDE
ncbi:hypothetical protein [Staphylococcus coagulans]|uniref:hypothetical protein n=1 Tax=Staphylococcus coagulans TaxID=74706 RepID=UPI0030EC063A